MGEATITAVTGAIETTGSDIMTIGAAIIVSIGLAMMAYRYVRRIAG